MMHKSVRFVDSGKEVNDHTCNIFHYLSHRNAGYFTGDYKQVFFNYM